MSYYDENQAKLCNFIKLEEVKLQRQSLFFGHRNVQHAGSGWKGNHDSRHHQYPTLESVDLKDADAVAYGD